MEPARDRAPRHLASRSSKWTCFEMTRKGFRPMNSMSPPRAADRLGGGRSDDRSGCSAWPAAIPHRDQLRPEALFGRIGRQSGQIIEPRKCMLRVAIVNRPVRDPAINEVVWKVADEQAIAPEARRALEVNGLRDRPDHRRAPPRAGSRSRGAPSAQGRARDLSAR